MSDEMKNSTQEAAETAQERENGPEGVNTRAQDEAPQEAAQGPQNEVLEFKKKENVEKEPPPVKDSYTHTFKRPVKYENKEFKTLVFYWGKLTGDDMISIENEMQAMNEYAIAPEMSASFLCRMAAKAAGVGSDLLGALPIGEFSKIKNEARSFLIGMGF